MSTYDTFFLELVSMIILMIDVSVFVPGNVMRFLKLSYILYEIQGLAAAILVVRTDKSPVSPKLGLSTLIQ
jgi:hypothetical protein